MIEENIRDGFKALYLGRFQIFHKGHLNIAKFIDSEPDISKIMIAVGSCQYSRFSKHPDKPMLLNPFTYEERKGMIDSALCDVMQKPYEIVGVKDLHVCELWYNNIMHYLSPDVLYTNEPREIKLFESNGTPTREIPPQKGGLHAQVIREMVWHDDNYEDYIPQGTVGFIKEKGIDKILTELYTSNHDELMKVKEYTRRDGRKTYEDFIIERDKHG